MYNSVLAGADDAFSDDAGGHGSHVAASAAGAVLLWDYDNVTAWDEEAIAVGSAPLARLSFVDMAPPGSSTLAVPSPFDTEYLPVCMYEPMYEPMYVQRQ